MSCCCSRSCLSSINNSGFGRYRQGLAGKLNASPLVVHGHDPITVSDRSDASQLSDGGTCTYQSKAKATRMRLDAVFSRLFVRLETVAHGPARLLAWRGTPAAGGVQSSCSGTGGVGQSPGWRGHASTSENVLIVSNSTTASLDSSSV